MKIKPLFQDLLPDREIIKLIFIVFYMQALRLAGSRYDDGNLLSNHAMARTQASNHQLQRDEILEMAATAFAAHSYPGTSMSLLASACGTSKARLYHYYPSKEAILFDLLDRYTRALIALAESHHDLPALIAAFLAEYEHSQTRHIALLNDVKFLEEPQRILILDAQRKIVELFAAAIQRSFPGRTHAQNRSAITMLLFGMINWTFTWLKPHQDADKISYADFAALVTQIFMNGMQALPVKPAVQAGQQDSGQS